MIESFFDKDYWVVDFLPKQVPEHCGGRFFSVEEYYLEPSRYVVLRERFCDILLKLYCYYDLRLFVDDDTEGIANPEPELLASHLKANKSELFIFIGSSETLITLGRNDTHMTVYAPSDDLLELIRTLAEAVGLFVWKSEQKNRDMTQLKTEEAYNAAMQRIEELLKVVTDETPTTDPNYQELDILSDMVAEYENRWVRSDLQSDRIEPADLQSALS